MSEEQAAAEKVRAGVAAEEAEVRRSTQATHALRDDAQRDLDAVLPALDAAMEALDALNKSDIIEIKSFQKPPALVQLTMEGVCVLLGVRIRLTAHAHSCPHVQTMTGTACNVGALGTRFASVTPLGF